MILSLVCIKIKEKVRESKSRREKGRTKGRRRNNDIRKRLSGIICRMYEKGKTTVCFSSDIFVILISSIFLILNNTHMIKM